MTIFLEEKKTSGYQNSLRGYFRINMGASSLLSQAVSVQQPSVLGDLPLQLGLDVQQHLVVVGLPLDVSPHPGQLALQAVDEGLELAQLHAVAGLGLHELALQGIFL